MRRFCFAVLTACFVFSASSVPAATLVIEAGQILSGDTSPQVVTGGDARSNTLLVEGSVHGTGYGGVSESGGDAVGNAAIVRGGSVGGSLMGGFSWQGSASGNTVIVDGGHVEGDVIGGRAPQGDAVHNTVTLAGSPVFGVNTHVWGGVGRFSGDETTGNTLNLLGFRGTVYEVNHFQVYNFALQADSRSGGPLVTIANLSAPVQLGAATVRLISVGGVTPWQVGDSVGLFSQASGLPLSAKTTGVRQGLSMLYDFDLSMDGDALTATVARAGHGNPQAPTVLRPHASALALTTQALELVAGSGMESAWRAAGDRDAGGRWQPFVAVAAGLQRYDAGAHIFLRGLSGMAGLSRRWSGERSSVMLGAFGEGGRGSYDSSETLGDGSSVSARGLLDYYGAGLLARMEGERGRWRGWHGELSFRTGAVGMDFRSGELDLPDLYGGVQRASFSTRTPYYSAHAGLGHSWSLSSATSLDVYGRAFWTWIYGSSATVLGEEVRFDPAQSWRLRGGTRLTHALGESAHVYVGLGWEQELDGRAGGSVSGWSMPSASLQGSTALGETGLSWRPGGDWAVNFGLQAFTGKREGVLGRLELSYTF